MSYAQQKRYWYIKGIQGYAKKIKKITSFIKLPKNKGDRIVLMLDEKNIHTGKIAKELLQKSYLAPLVYAEVIYLFLNIKHVCMENIQS